MDARAHNAGEIRKAVVAGVFYPDSSEELTGAVREYLESGIVKSLQGDLRALMVPHAGYVYSGSVAGAAFRQLARNYSKVILLGSNHNPKSPYFRISVADVAGYETPLGTVSVSADVQKLLCNYLFEYVPAAHQTHIIEVELPFLQVVQKDFEIVPLITGVLSPSEVEEAAEVISSIIDNDTLIVISSDLSHYHPYDQAVSLDSSCLEAVEKQNEGAVARSECCGRTAVQIVLEIAREKGWKTETLEYQNSGDTAGTKDEVVGYGAMAFYCEKYTEEECRWLLDCAKSAVASEFESEVEYKPVQDIPLRLKEKKGCFVTLHLEGQLRGCIGSLQSDSPLEESVRKNAVNAAFQDPRFSPVTSEEFSDLEFEISILTEPHRVGYQTPEELLKKLIPGRTGVIVKSRYGQSTYLPQVWDHFSDKKEFMESLCRKGGMESDRWEKPDTDIMFYQVILVKES